MTVLELVQRTSGRTQRRVLKAAVEASTCQEEIAALAAFVKKNRQLAWMILHHRHTSPAAWMAIASHCESLEVIDTLFNLFKEGGDIPESLAAALTQNPNPAIRDQAWLNLGSLRQTSSWIQV